MTRHDPQMDERIKAALDKLEAELARAGWRHDDAPPASKPRKANNRGTVVFEGKYRAVCD